MRRWSSLVAVSLLAAGSLVAPARFEMQRRNDQAVSDGAAALERIRQDQASNRGPLRRYYVSESSGRTIRRANGRWENVDNKTGEVRGYYDELNRTKDYVEMLQLDRKLPTRLYANRIEQRLDGKWQKVADGHWESR
ncbi:MAG TPA: hypothetical protein VFG04_09240 [Planctomycetaceae bacterium]|nr:hypothetical protein [Planctomycetaceae bacterium]